MADSVLPDEGCKVLDGEGNDEEWDKNDNKNVADSDDTHILVKEGGRCKMQYGVKIFKKFNMTAPYN